jgi:hypothetical protein
LGDPFAGGGRVADHGREVPMPTRLYTQHAEAGLRIVEGDSLNDAGKHFAVGPI